MVRIVMPGAAAPVVWAYGVRTLTRITGSPRTDIVGADTDLETQLEGAKLRAMITRYARIRSTSYVTVGAGLSSTVSIEPPTGEVWELLFVYRDIRTAVSGSYVSIYHGYLTYGEDSAKSIPTSRIMIAAGPFHSAPGYPIYTKAHNAASVDVTADFAYFGFKLQASKIPLVKIISVLKPIKSNPGSDPEEGEPAPYLDYLSPLKDKIVYDDDLEPAILIAKDIPLEVDEKGNVIVREKVYCKLREFDRLFGDIIADPTRRPIMDEIKAKMKTDSPTWCAIVETWRKEGIEF